MDIQKIRSKKYFVNPYNTEDLLINIIANNINKHNTSYAKAKAKNIKSD